MSQYIVRRLFYLVLSAAVLSIVAFLIIQLPPGDFVTKFVFQMEQRGLVVDEAMMRALYQRFGFDRPLHEQYFKWIGNIVLRGDFGESMAFNAPVSELIGERFVLTVTISISTLIITYIIAVPIGIYSATHPYSVGDYAGTVFGFIGLATPNFLLALILMFLALRYFGWSPGGLFSREYLAAPWSFGRVLDLMKHLPVPLFVIGTAGTAGLIRVLRSSLADELGKQYVITARAKGGRRGAHPVQIPGAPRHQPDHQCHRLPVAGYRLRRGVGSYRTEPAHHWPAAAQRTAATGHVPGQQRHSHARHVNHDRNPGIRPHAGDSRSTHSL